MLQSGFSGARFKGGYDIDVLQSAQVIALRVCWPARGPRTENLRKCSPSALKSALKSARGALGSAPESAIEGVVLYSEKTLESTLRSTPESTPSTLESTLESTRGALSEISLFSAP